MGDRKEQGSIKIKVIRENIKKEMDKAYSKFHDNPENNIPHRDIGNGLCVAIAIIDGVLKEKNVEEERDLKKARKLIFEKRDEDE